MQLIYLFYGIWSVDTGLLYDLYATACGAPPLVGEAYHRSLKDLCPKASGSSDPGLAETPL